MNKLIKYILLISFAFTTIFPFYWLLISSFKESYEIYGHPFSLPKVWKFENYINAFETAKVGLYFSNSIVVSFCTVAVLILISSMASYVLSRVYRNLGLYIFFTVGIMIPAQTLLIPTFVLLKTFGLINNLPGLIIVFITGNLSLSIFILVGFMRNLPYEIEESALIDGCSRVRMFFSIIFPLSKAGLATIGTLSFLNCWNEYLFSYVLISNAKIKTLTLGVMSLKGQYTTDYGLLTAGLALSIIPVVIIYIFFQEQIIKGMTAGAVKG